MTQKHTLVSAWLSHYSCNIIVKLDTVCKLCMDNSNASMLTLIAHTTGVVKCNTCSDVVS